MSSSRARTRLAAVFAAIPVLVAGGPLVTPATASTQYGVTNLMADGQVVGPNTGYLGLGVGQTGTTAMFKVTPPSSSATISSLEVTLTQLDNPGTYIYQAELDATDGLALYADVNGSGTFDAADKTTGLRSNGYRAGRVQANGDIPFVVTFNEPATGSGAYFLGMHPASSAVTGRRFTFRVDAGDITGSGGSGPIDAASTPVNGDSGDKRMVVDSAAPVTPPRTAFTPKSQRPGLEDEYSVAPGVAGAETTAKIAFFKSATSVAPASLLTRLGFDPTKTASEQLDEVAFANAVNTADPTAAQVVKIGDGSGIYKSATPPVLVAKNNQDSNAVYARLIDTAGNVSGVVELSDCFIAPGTSACETPRRGNPVIAPDAPSTAELNNGSAVPGINIANEAAAPAKSTTAAATTTARTTRSDADNKAAVVENVDLRIAQKTAGGAYDTVYTTVTKRLAYASNAASATFDTRLSTDANKTTEKGIQQGSGIAFVVATNLDRALNASIPAESIAYPKDTVSPTVTIGSTKLTPLKGETVSVQFSEPMTRLDIKEIKPDATTGLCADDSNDDNVEKTLDVVNATDTADRAWGRGNCFVWSTDSVATITLGDPRPTASASVTIPLPVVGDRVKFGTGTSAVTDKVGNPLVGEAATPTYTTIGVPAASPLTGQTKDLDADGRLDAIYAEFSTGLNLASANDASLANFSVRGGTTVPVTEVVAEGTDPSKLLFKFANQFGTGETPQLRLSIPAGSTDTGVLDGNNKVVDPFSITPIDKAMPQPKSAVTVDNNRDGRLDQVVVTYTENIKPERDNNPASVNVKDPAYNVAGYVDANPTGGTEYRNPATPISGSPIPTRTLELKRPNTNPDTNATPVVKFTRFKDAAGTVYGPVDVANVEWSNTTTGDKWTMTAADGAAPFYVSRITRDLDSDGRLDAVDVKFTENIPTVSAGATFTVAGHQILDQYSLTPDTIRIVIDETRALTGDTAPASAPTMQYLGGVRDLVGNAMTPDAAPVATTDGAGPAIMAACPGSPKGSNGMCPEDDPLLPTDDGTKMNVFFSEPLTAGTVTGKDDFVVEQPLGAPKKTVVSATVLNAPDNKSSTVTLTFAQGTLSSTVDSVVRLATAGAVSDAGNIVSTQQANVPAFAPPTVGLNITCPTPANEGYCQDNKINTGATGNNAVTRWRLAESPRATLPADSEFKSGIPSVYPESGVLAEGPHTLYLSGKDELGRLSPEISDSITILKPPTIGQVQFLNTTSRAAGTYPKTTTVLDGDLIKIGANAYGTDAEEWAENNAPTDGGCLNENMSIDVRSLSGVATHNAVAPFRCDLQETTPPHRQMVFSTVTTRGTTNLPVGTAVKVTASDPGSIIVDGANGKPARRQFISVNARRSWMIPDAAVIQIPVKAYSGIPLNTKKVGYRDGAVLKSPTGGYFYIENGVKRPVAASRLSYWKIPTTRAYAVTSTELSRIPTGATIGGARHAVGTWIKSSTGTIYQIVKNSNGAIVRRKLSSASALRTRVPSTHVYPLNSYDAKLPIDSWLIGYRDGTLLKFSDGTYGVIARGSLRKFANALTFNTLRFTASHALTVNPLAMPNGRAFRTGAVIDRYKLGEVVVKVTNKAGATVTALVPNSDGLYGVGTLDPAPADWDYTR